LRVEGALYAVSAVAYEARFLVRDQSAAVVDGGEGIPLLGQARKDRRHDVARPAEGDLLRVLDDQKGAESVGRDGQEDDAGRRDGRNESPPNETDEKDGGGRKRDDERKNL